LRVDDSDPSGFCTATNGAQTITQGALDAFQTSPQTDSVTVAFLRP
jgi:hypothetical protein